MPGNIYQVVHQAGHILKYKMVDFLKQVTITGAGNNPVSIVYMPRTKWLGRYDITVYLKPGNNIRYS